MEKKLTKHAWWMKWLKHSWTLQIKILSKDILAHTIYSAKTYVNAIRSRNYPKTTKLLLTSDPGALPPKNVQAFDTHLNKREKKKKKKRWKGKRKRKVSTWDVHWRQVRNGWITKKNSERSRQTSFRIKYQLHLKITIIRKWIEK